MTAPPKNLTFFPRPSRVSKSCLTVWQRTPLTCSLLRGSQWTPMTWDRTTSLFHYTTQRQGSGIPVSWSKTSPIEMAFTAPKAATSSSTTSTFLERTSSHPDFHPTLKKAPILSTLSPIPRASSTPIPPSPHLSTSPEHPQPRPVLPPSAPKITAPTPNHPSRSPSSRNRPQSPNSAPSPRKHSRPSSPQPRPSRSLTPTSLALHNYNSKTVAQPPKIPSTYNPPRP